MTDSRSTDPSGTYACPICGKDYPHKHVDVEVETLLGRLNVSGDGLAILNHKGGNWRSLTTEELVTAIIGLTRRQGSDENCVKKVADNLRRAMQLVHVDALGYPPLAAAWEALQGHSGAK